MDRKLVPANESFASGALYASCSPPKLHLQGRVSGAGIERAGRLDQDGRQTTSNGPVMPRVEHLGRLFLSTMSNYVLLC